jgi:hypothetical protein
MLKKNFLSTIYAISKVKSAWDKYRNLDLLRDFTKHLRTCSERHDLSKALFIVSGLSFWLGLERMTSC